MQAGIMDRLTTVCSQADIMDHTTIQHTAPALAEPITAGHLMAAGMVTTIDPLVLTIPTMEDIARHIEAIRPTIAEATHRIVVAHQVLDVVRIRDL